VTVAGSAIHWPQVRQEMQADAGMPYFLLAACNCVGPQDGQPRCPCQMRGVIEREGRWIQKEVDLGPVVR
jgi:hypothetical protein